MKIVPITDIPKDVQPAPEDKLMELYKTCLRMENICLEKSGAGLSAVQVGIPWKLFVVRKPELPTFRYFVNCEYVPVLNSKQYDSIEGCLSILDSVGLLRYFSVKRYEDVILKGKELLVSPDLILGEIDEVLPNGWISTVVQHEVDHHRGILISDGGKEMDVW